GFVHQEISLCEHMSVAENIFMGRMPTNKFGMVNKNLLIKKSDEILKLFKEPSRPKPNKIIGELSISQKQIVEIARAISLNCKIIILDEPTSSLTESETEILFEIIENLKNNNISVIYISHRLSEIFKLCEKITIMKDGEVIDTLEAEDTNEKEVVNKMVGRDIKNFFPEKANIEDNGRNVILRVENLSRDGYFKDVNFALYDGEILGFSGLTGSGRSEVARAICGIDRKNSGNIFINNNKVAINSYSKSMKYGLVYLTENRKEDGLFLGLDIKRNLTVSGLEKISNKRLLLWVNSRKEIASSKKMVKDLDIRLSSINQKINSLSGGNQQKVIVARWLFVDPKIIILDEPTKGIDVKTKAEIYSLIRQLADNGIGTIIISSELPEIIGLCDRIIVMHEGEIAGILKDKEQSEAKIVALASGIKEK
ncbi:MAG: sugar ABC transporter ATP-binding protein, partial [Actinomycetota bacterium]|nr:sugar ABC transporter ATP-binding protein [Actinomycetota bacterium]